jgi:hypothetical protein
MNFFYFKIQRVRWRICYEMNSSMKKKWLMQLAFHAYCEIDLNIDEATLNEDKNAASITLILGRIYSVHPTVTSGILICNFFCICYWIICWGGGEPNDGSSFLSKLVFEFLNFLPSNCDIVCTNGQCFAASLCCIIADGLMRSYSERTKSHSGYRRLLVMRSLYSEGRYGTSNWARKCSKENEICYFDVLCQCSADDHLKDPSDLSLF